MGNQASILENALRSFDAEFVSVARTVEDEWPGKLRALCDLLPTWAAGGEGSRRFVVPFKNGKGAVEALLRLLEAETRAVNLKAREWVRRSDRAQVGH